MRLPGRWFQMAAILNGAGCLAWAAELLGQSDIGKLLQSTEEAFTGPSPVMFLPYLTGERTPHNNPHAKGVLFGLTPSSTPQQVTQAVLEGVALSLADCQAYVAETGPLPDRIAVNGGAAKSRFWMKLVASAIGRTVVLYEGAETGPAFGAARLARLAATGEDPAAVCVKPAIAAEIAPDPSLSRRLCGAAGQVPVALQGRDAAVLISASVRPAASVLRAAASSPRWDRRHREAALHVAQVVAGHADVVQHVVVELLQALQVLLGDPAAEQAAQLREHESTVAGESLMENVVAHGDHRLSLLYQSNNLIVRVQFYTVCIQLPTRETLSS